MCLASSCRLICAALALAALTALGSGPARAQELAFTEAPATIARDETGTLRLELDLPTGIYEDLVVELRFPHDEDFPAAIYSNSTANADFSRTTSWDGRVRVITWTRNGTLDLSTSTSTRQFLYLFTIAPETLDKTPLTFTASLTGLKDGLDLTVPPVTVTTEADRGLVYTPQFHTESDAWYSNARHPANPSLVGIHRAFTARLSTGTAGRYPSRLQSTFDLPAGTALISTEARSGHLEATSQPLTTTTTATPWQILATPTPISLDFNEGLAIMVRDPLVRARFFIPCGALPAADGALFATEATLGVSWDDFYGVPTNFTHVLSAVTGNTGTTCGQGGGVYTHANLPVVRDSGTQVSFGYQLRPPVGVPELEDAFFAVIYPPGLVGLNVDDWSDFEDDWEFFSCDFSTATLSGDGDRPTVTDFLSQMHTHCRDTWEPGDTHAIHYAPTLGGDRLDAHHFRLNVFIPPDWSDDHGGTVETTAYFTGTAGVDAWGDELVNPSDDLFERDFAANLPTHIVPTLSGGYTFGPPALDSNGNPAIIYATRRQLGWSGLPPRNPLVRIDVPDGIIVQVAELRYTGTHSVCQPPDEVLSVSPLDQSPIFLRRGTGTPGYTPPGDCATAGEVYFRFDVDPDFPFFHEQPIHFTVTHTAENQTNDENTTWIHSRHVIVAAGQDARLTAGCDETGGLTFDALAINRGQDAIEDGVLTFEVPTGVAITQIVPNAAVAETSGTLEVSTNGGASFGVPGANLAGVTHVRLSGLQIPGGTFTAMPPAPGFLVTIDPLGQTEPLTASAVMFSPNLGSTDPRIVAITPGTCPGPVTLRAFFDLNGDGVRQGSEPWVTDGHTFELTLAPSSLTGASVDPEPTDPDGYAVWSEVVPGDYEITYLSAPPSAGVWVMTSAYAFTLDSAGSAYVEVGLSCGCEDPDPTDHCVDALCTLEGACEATILDDTSPCDEPSVVWVHVLVDGEDHSIRCHRTEEPNPTIVCDDTLSTPVCAQ